MLLKTISSMTPRNSSIFSLFIFSALRTQSKLCAISFSVSSQFLFLDQRVSHRYLLCYAYYFQNPQSFSFSLNCYYFHHQNLGYLVILLLLRLLMQINHYHVIALSRISNFESSSGQHQTSSSNIIRWKKI